MVTNPIDYVEPLAKAGASGFTFHVEVSKGGVLLSEHSCFLLILVAQCLEERNLTSDYDEFISEIWNN